MSNIPIKVWRLFRNFAQAFSQPTLTRFVVFAMAAILTVGAHTVANVLRTVKRLAPGHPSSYHRLFSRRKWSLWVVSRCLMTYVLDYFVPEGTVVLAGDDTVDEHRGRKVYGKGRHRDPIRSSHSYTAYCFGHKWVVLSVLIRLPFARRAWALPVMIVLYRTRDWNKKHKRAHRTPEQIMESMLRVVLRWFPDRRFRFAGDGGFGTHQLARLAAQKQKQLSLVSRFYPNANLYLPPPSRDPKRKGRPRVKGAKLPTPQEVVRSTPRERLTVAWYGGGQREVETVTGEGWWYKSGKGLVPVKWVYVHDLTGTHRDDYFFTTDTSMSAAEIIEAYVGRWNLEVTFEEARAYLGFGSNRCFSQKSVLREAPFLLWLYTIVVVLYSHIRSVTTTKPIIQWQGKSNVTFSDAITHVRRWLWSNWIFRTLDNTEGVSKLPKELRSILLGALAPAAY